MISSHRKMGCLMWAYEIFCLQLFLFHCRSSATLCSQEQSSALLQFNNLFTYMNRSYFDCDFFATYSKVFAIESSPYCDGRCPSYPKTMFWKEDIDCCSWEGVTCDAITGHVIGLDLSCGWLYGYIPSNSTLFHLHHLQKLNLAFNNFTLSPISPYFSQFSGLTHLNLSSTNFTGQIPSEISHLSSLVSLDLSSSNSLRLENPVFHGIAQNLTKLTVLNLDSVDMSAIMPSSFCNLSSSLTSLSLKDCGLQGNYPEKIFHLPNLKLLSLANNFNLRSSLPKVNWSGPLKYLDVSDISFSGELFCSIGNLISLRHLDLSNCTFFGSVPLSLGNLTQLTYLSLSLNSFVGPIPTFLSRLKLLSYLNLAANNFVGEFPSIFVNLTQLSHLSLSSNQITGPIPSNINGMFQNLAIINLSNNSLNGSLPSWLLNLPLLEAFGLSYNELTGSLKDGFQSNSLKIIQLNNNRLHGSIPNSIFELVNLTHLLLSTNNLSGSTELDMFAKLKKLEVLYLSHNTLSVSDTLKANSSFHQLRYLGLAACNMSEFPDILRRADQLLHIDLSGNKIRGQIPNWMWETGIDTWSWLNLSYNLLTGIEQLPWKNLEYLDLDSNLIEGPLPIPSPYLRLFSLSNNKLTGEIPHLVCNMSAIEVIKFSYNSLSGTIPECLGSVSSIHVLDLRKNKFYGNIPGKFAKGSLLRTLNFNGNRLEGPVPQSLVDCKMLEVLDLGNNKINDNFPYWLGNLPKLQVLVLCSNNFYGSIRVSTSHKSSFPMLRIFDLSNNNFTGILPASLFENLKAMMNLDEAKGELNYIGERYYQDSVMMVIKGFEMELVKIITIFTIIDFSNNNFSGEISKSIAKLHSLRLLNLSQNSLTGHIPFSLKNLNALESLDLSSNGLVGEIPPQLASLTFLAFLNLSENQLVGPIPRENQFETFQNASYNGNPGLCGFPLQNKCGVHETPPPESSTFHGENQNISSWFDWKFIIMGFGFGLLLGLFTGYTVLSTRKPQQFLRMIDRVFETFETRKSNGRD